MHIKHAQNSAYPSGVVRHGHGLVTDLHIWAILTRPYLQLLVFHMTALDIERVVRDVCIFVY